MDAGHVVVQVDFSARRARGHQAGKADAACASNGADYRLIEPLTDRELCFLDCLASGVSNKEIARSLNVSENTVKFHLKNVYSKFAVRTRLQAINAAHELGLLKPQVDQIEALARAM